MKLLKVDTLVQARERLLKAAKRMPARNGAGRALQMHLTVF